jgi:hypothetical protein
MNMKYRYCIWLFVLALCAPYGRTRGDDLAANTVYVKSEAYGRYYAKSIPDELYGSKGMTRIYAVNKGEDQLIETYPWYSLQIDLGPTAWGISVVRIGACRMGQEVSKSDLAVKTLREYSTLDLAPAIKGSGADSEHWSRYCCSLKILGYRSMGSNDYVFDVEGGGKTLSFDVKTGELLKDPTTK